MISGVRNMIQASIDEKAEVIQRLISRTPDLIQNEFDAIEIEAKKIAEEKCNEDPEVCRTIYNRYISQRAEDEVWMIMEFYQSMVLLICSFAETTLKSMMKKTQSRRMNGVRYLDDRFAKIRDQYELTSFPEIEFFWPHYSSFLDKRNDIAHGHKDDADQNDCEKFVVVEKEELVNALEGAHRLLRSIADAIDIKTKGYIEESADYLWTPQGSDI